jgi:hypothetical protein
LGEPEGAEDSGSDRGDQTETDDQSGDHRSGPSTTRAKRMIDVLDRRGPSDEDDRKNREDAWRDARDDSCNESDE